MNKYTSKVIVCSLLFICITITAIYFQKVGILWWYVLPTLIVAD
jgi:hypothetical protein